MSDNGDTKDDVKVPEGEVGEKINKLFREEEKDTSMFYYSLLAHMADIQQTSWSSLPWEKKLRLTPKRLLRDPSDVLYIDPLLTSSTVPHMRDKTTERRDIFAFYISGCGKLAAQFMCDETRYALKMEWSWVRHLRQMMDKMHEMIGIKGQRSL